MLGQLAMEISLEKIPFSSTHHYKPILFMIISVQYYITADLSYYKKDHIAMYTK